MEAFEESRAKAASIAANLRVRKPMLAKVPRNFDLVLMDRVFRETDKYWTGPYPVERDDETQVYVIVKDNKFQHNLDQVVPAEEYDRLVNGGKPMEVFLKATKQFRLMKPKMMSSKPKSCILETHEFIRRTLLYKSVRNLKLLSTVAPGKWSSRKKFHQNRSSSTVDS